MEVCRSRGIGYTSHVCVRLCVDVDVGCRRTLRVSLYLGLFEIAYSILFDHSAAETVL